VDDEPKLSREEWARQQRRKAYQLAKERRANDPKQLAFLEAMKERRREANGQAKERRRAQKAQKADRRAQERAAQDRQLMILVQPSTHPRPRRDA
jgi:hypothetical protein